MSLHYYMAALKLGDLVYITRPLIKVILKGKNIKTHLTAPSLSQENLANTHVTPCIIKTTPPNAKASNRTRTTHRMKQKHRLRLIHHFFPYFNIFKLQ